MASPASSSVIVSCPSLLHVREETSAKKLVGVRHVAFFADRFRYHVTNGALSSEIGLSCLVLRTESRATFCSYSLQVACAYSHVLKMISQLYKSAVQKTRDVFELDRGVEWRRRHVDRKKMCH